MLLLNGLDRQECFSGELFDMYTNGSCTLYLSSLDYKPLIIQKCFITKRTPNAFSKLGLSYTENGFVMFQGNTDLVFSEGKDMLVKGQTIIDVDVSTPKAKSETLQAIKNSGGVTVMQATYLDYGLDHMCHWELSCK